MCGRYTITKTKPEIVARFSPDLDQLEVKLPRYNLAPSQNAPILYRNENQTVLTSFRWGLIPSWSKTENTGYSMINARVESVMEKRSYSKLLKNNRCLAVADGYYEWVITKQGKVPHRIQNKDKGLFAFAGLWNQWQSPNEQVINSFTILTMSSEYQNSIKSLHDRMPVILNPGEESDWLRSEDEPGKILERAIESCKSGEVIAYPVSSLVNSPKNDSVSCIETHEPGRDQLFEI